MVDSRNLKRNTARELHEAGLRATMPRRHVLKMLEVAAKKHMSADEIYMEMKRRGLDVGYASIYRVLTQFVVAGLVIRHHFKDGPALYELAEEEHHDHMVCLETGSVIEFQNERIERLQEEIAEKHGYELADHILVLYVRPLAAAEGNGNKKKKSGKKTPP